MLYHVVPWKGNFIILENDLLTQILKKLDKCVTKDDLVAIKSNFDSVESTLAFIKQEFDSVKSTLAFIEQEFDSVKSTLAFIEQEFDSVKSTLAFIEQELNIVKKSTLLMEHDYALKLDLLLETRCDMYNDNASSRVEISNLKKTSELHSYRLDLIESKI